MISVLPLDRFIIPSPLHSHMIVTARFFIEMLRWLYKLQKVSFAGAQLAGGFMQFITLLVNNYSLPRELSRELRMPEKISEAVGSRGREIAAHGYKRFFVRAKK